MTESKTPTTTSPLQSSPLLGMVPPFGTAPLERFVYEAAARAELQQLSPPSSSVSSSSSDGERKADRDGDKQLLHTAIKDQAQQRQHDTTTTTTNGDSNG